jgi:hypothetical protein
MELGGKIVIVRDFNPETDYNFVISTWLNNYYHGSADFTKHLSRDNYYKFHHMLLERILDRAKHSKVAVFEDEPNIILGFLIKEDGYASTVVHYLYCKPAYRKHGVAKLLWASLPGEVQLYCTHLTKIGSRLKNKIKGLEYVPYMVS